MFSYEKQLQDSNQNASNVAYTYNFKIFFLNLWRLKNLYYLVSLLKEVRERGLLLSVKFLKALSII